MATRLVRRQATVGDFFRMGTDATIQAIVEGRLRSDAPCPITEALKEKRERAEEKRRADLRP